MANRNKDVTDNQVCSYFTDDIDLRVYFSYYFNSFGVKPINIIHFLEYFQTQTKNKKKTCSHRKPASELSPIQFFDIFKGQRFIGFMCFLKNYAKHIHPAFCTEASQLFYIRYYTIITLSSQELHRVMGLPV